MLADTLAQHADIIRCTDMKHAAQIKKKEVWQEVAQTVSAVATTPRTVHNCRKRWDDLRHRVRNILADNRRAAMATGGGPHSPVKLMPWEETASTFIDPESIEGFGEQEVGAASSPEEEAKSSDDPCLHDLDLGESDICLFEEDRYLDVGPTQVPSTTLATTTLAATTPATSTLAANDSFEARLSRVEARQESMLELMWQQIADGNDSMRAIATAIAAKTAAVEAYTTAMRECLGALTQALMSILPQMQRPHLGAGMGPATDTSTATTPSTSAQSSPMRMTRRSARRLDTPGSQNSKEVE
ncbi:nuclear apoptosis-inducing factor 1-like [Ambystoma mexicanum]|uniref:nuclear apoptosis-inducing factor 1-like n=1 Tax=Ambystoma mexicanum TaxID=8296 RepID=UPI0037E73210